MDRPTVQIDPLPPPPMPELECRGRESPEQTLRSPGTTAGCLGCNAVWTVSSSPFRPLPLDRRSEVLNEALAKEVERNVRRRDETGSAAGELAVPRESKDVPIPPDSDSGKRRALEAATVDASSSGLQMGGSCTVAEALTQQDSMADGSRMDVEGEEKDESRNSNAQDIRRRILTRTSREES